MSIGRNALYFEDYVLSIQYFNQVINAKPYLADPYFFRGLAKMNLDDFSGAESDCSEAIERNPFVVNAYQVRGLARIQQNKLEDAVKDYVKANDLEIHVPNRKTPDGDDWNLVDVGNIVVHLMSQEARDFYDLEKLWHAGEKLL